jgi:cell division septum initiation protein DivIVA
LQLEVLRHRCASAANAASSSMKDIAIPPDALTRFRAAASEFARSATSRASRLQAVHEDIAALRAKGASFRTISELLGRCGIHASDTCVMRFCQRVLGEAPARARKSKHRVASRPAVNARSTSAESANGHATQSTASAVSEAAQVALLDDLLSYQPSPNDKSSAQSGPRIAKIKFANPGDL